MQNAKFASVMLYSQEDLLFSAALAVYIATSVFVSIIRWGHRCEPFAKHMDYYHPAWKTVVYCFLMNLILTPVVFMPAEADAVMALRLMIMLGSPYFCAMFLFTHFGRMVNMGNWKVSLYILSLPFFCLIGASLWLAIIPGTQIQGGWARQLGAVSGTMAILFLFSFICSLYMINKARRNFSEENYSSKEDFPKNFIVQAIILSGSHVLISWFISFSGSKIVLSIGLLLLCVLMIIFLLIALHPHRALDINRMEDELRAQELVNEAECEVWSAPEPVAEEETQEDQPLSASRKDEILQIIRRSVETEKAYLDSHLTLARLARLCGVNRSYLSSVMGENLGGFFAYINRCRLNYAANYKKENPDASVEDIATASGFGSRQSFYNARKQFDK